MISSSSGSGQLARSNPCWAVEADAVRVPSRPSEARMLNDLIRWSPSTLQPQISSAVSLFQHGISLNGGAAF